MPLLADFGSSSIKIERVSVPWMAIELSNRQNHGYFDTGVKYTKETDVWAFGMVLYVSITECKCFPP